MGRKRSRSLSAACLWLAPLAHVVSFGLMWKQVEPFYTGFYSLAWWSYILFLSALNHRRGRNSLLFDRPREFLWIFLISTPIWLFFELCNFRLQNWHYVGVPSEWWIRLPGVFVAFGTVVPGIFETWTWLRNLGAAAGQDRGEVVRPPVLTQPAGPVAGSWYEGRTALIGGLMLGAALVWPAAFFPLLWVGPLLLLPWLVTVAEGGEGLGRQAGGLEAGAARRLLAAGLICGLLWEFWNFWAGSKWIYSIPYLNAFPVFEMPLAGFLGFPPFALICYWMVRLLRPLRALITTSPLRVVVGALVYFLTCWLVILGIERMTVLEYRPLWSG